MKLVNNLAVAFLGALLATGCTVTDDTSNDGGTTDGGGKDTAVTPTDTGSPGDVATDTPSDVSKDPCGDCLKANCAAEITACASRGRARRWARRSAGRRGRAGARRSRR